MAPRTVRALSRLLVGALAAGFAITAAAQTAFPSRPVRLVVPYPAGGGIDLLARGLAQQLSQRWSQPVVVENKPGGGTLPAAQDVARAAPDGHVILMTSDATLTINPHLYARLPYDPVRDFAPVTQLVFLHQMLLANVAVPAGNVAELVAFARAKPGALAYGSYGNGSQPHLAMETLKSATGIDVLHVPYKGIPQVLPALIGNEVQLTFSGAASGGPHLRAGRVKALAVGGTARLPAFPEVPTFAEQGYPQVPAQAWFGLVVPAATPRAVIERIQQDARAVLTEPAFREREVDAKGFALVASSPAEFATFMREDSVRNAQAVRLSGAKAD